MRKKVSQREQQRPSQAGDNVATHLGEFPALFDQLYEKSNRALVVARGNNLQAAGVKVTDNEPPCFPCN